MAYATFTDITKRYNPLLTMIGTTTQNVTTEDISSIYIFDAEGFVNAYVGAKYTVPVAMPEPIITMLTADIAIYKILEDRVPRIPEFADRRFNNAVATLEKIRDGDMVLSSASQTIISGGDQEAWSNNQSYAPVFTPAAVVAASCDIGSPGCL